MIKSYLLILISGLFLAYSCSTGCNEPVKTELQVDFYTLQNDTLRALLIDSLSVYGEGRIDSLLLDTIVQETGFLKLPLNKNTDQSTFILYNKYFTGKFTVKYTKTTEFISTECGCAMSFVIDSVLISGDSLKKAEVLHPQIIPSNTNTNETTQAHIRLYF